ncbi:NADH dehydrogenase [ubiquinone] iron-sulfur protein 5-like [Thomomys bottae]
MYIPDKGTAVDNMHLFDVQNRVSISLDHNLSIQSAEQPSRMLPNTTLSKKKAQKEYKIEPHDLHECFYQLKTIKQLKLIRKQWAKLTEEGKYTPPPHHKGQGRRGPDQVLCIPGKTACWKFLPDTV